VPFVEKQLILVLLFFALSIGLGDLLRDALRSIGLVTPRFLTAMFVGLAISTLADLRISTFHAHDDQWRDWRRPELLCRRHGNRQTGRAQLRPGAAVSVADDTRRRRGRQPDECTNHHGVLPVARRLAISEARPLEASPASDSQWPFALAKGMDTLARLARSRG
jgi:hypothetical protein